MTIQAIRHTGIVVSDMDRSLPQLFTEHLNSNQEPAFLKSFACKILQKSKRAAYTQACRKQLSPVFID